MALRPISTAVVQFKYYTKANFDALVTKDRNTYYVVEMPNFNRVLFLGEVQIEDPNGFPIPTPNVEYKDGRFALRGTESILAFMYYAIAKGYTPYLALYRKHNRKRKWTRPKQIGVDPLTGGIEFGTNYDTLKTLWTTDEIEDIVPFDGGTTSHPLMYYPIYDWESLIRTVSGIYNNGSIEYTAADIPWHEFRFKDSKKGDISIVSTAGRINETHVGQMVSRNSFTFAFRLVLARTNNAGTEFIEAGPLSAPITIRLNKVTGYSPIVGYDKNRFSIMTL